MSGYLGDVAALARKDLLVELRTRDTVPSMLLFVVAALVVFLGDQLGGGGQLSTGVVVVLGIRIFSNAAAIRRRVFSA